MICAEINEKIPPPLKFTVLYDPRYSWHSDHFYGQSIAQLYCLCEKYNYDLVELHYNNAFLIPKELNVHRALSPEAAYEAGYRSKTDRLKKFPYNANFEKILEMNPENAKKFVNEFFKEYSGQYELW